MPARRSRSRKRTKAYREFVSEAEEILERLRGDLADLADQRSAGRAVDPDVVNRLFRSAHSLKGLAGMFNLDALSELSHRLEDLLDGMRLGRVSLRSRSVEFLEEGVRLVATLLSNLDDESGSRDDSERVSAWMERLRQHGTQPASAARGDDLQCLDLDPALLRALTEYEEHRLRENMQRGFRIVLVEATFEVLSFDEGLAELTRDARAIGEVLSTLPSPGAEPESQIRFGLLVATELTAHDFAQRMDLPHARTRVVYEPADRHGVEPASALPAGAGVSRDRVPGARAAMPPGDAAAEIESLRSISETVRVDIHKLDELMNLVGDLVIRRGALSPIAERLAADAKTSGLAAELRRVDQAIDRKLQELRAGVLEVRMVPLHQVFEKLTRVVRRLRRDLGKDVRLEVRGADTELDKLIVERLIDSLLHVVRNAFDHGIEPPGERLAAGKAAEGLIRLEAFQRGNHVVVQVADDGRGIDVEAVRARAGERGIVSRDQVLTRKEVLELLLLPGFSMREEVTETSGRGVGMDVVKANLTALSGVVELDSIAGSGTTVSMTLPVTLATVQALLVRVADQRFAIPLNSIVETLALGASDIQKSEGRELLDLRGTALLLRRLADEFELEAAAPNETPFAVVLGLGDARLGLLVDEFLGQQNTIIKPIQGPIRNVRGIAGATDVGDRSAVLVLDVAAILDDAFRRREAA